MTPRRHQFAFHSGRNDNNLVRIAFLGATSNQPYPVLGRPVGRVAHRSPRRCTDEGNDSHLLMVAEH